MNIFGKKSKKDVKPVPKVDIIHNVRLPVFGVELTEAISRSKCHDGVQVPLVVRKCIDYVAQHGMLLEGIYRISPPKGKLDELERAANSGEMELRFNDAHEASGLLKRYLRQLSEHIFTEKLKPKFDLLANNCKCNALCTCPCVQELKELMKSLPSQNYTLLAYIFIHAQAVVDQQKFNKMSLSALGVLLQPMLNLSKNQVRIFLLNSVSSQSKEESNMPSRLFEDVNFKQYVPPKSLQELKNHLPEQETELQEEICKQQSLLEYVQTKEDDQVINSTLREQEMWQVQEAIKILTGKLKSLPGQLDTSQEDLLTETITSIHSNVTNQNVGHNKVEEIKVNPMLSESRNLFLEKQLIAIQSSLKDEITAEKRNIVQLLTRLREIHSQLPQEATEKLNRHRLSQQMETNAANGFSHNNTDEHTSKENDRKEELTKEVIRLRNICGQLRARLEEDSVLLTNAAANTKATKVAVHSGQLNTPSVQQTRQEETAASLLVTRF